MLVSIVEFLYALLQATNYFQLVMGNVPIIMWVPLRQIKFKYLDLSTEISQLGPMKFSQNRVKLSFEFSLK